MRLNMNIKKDHDGKKMFQDILDIINVQYDHNCVSKSKRALFAL